MNQWSNFIMANDGVTADFFGLVPWSWKSIFIGIMGSSVTVWGAYRFMRHFRSDRNGHDLSNKVFCVTGATGGLGSALARTLAAQGARLVLTGRNMDALRRLSFELSETYPEMHAPVLIELNLTDLGALESNAKEMLKAFGHIDAFIHNAGVSSRGAAMDTSFSVDFEVMKINYLAPVALTKEILPTMLRRGCGTIAVVSSVQGRISIPQRSSYAASKHAVQAYFDALRAEVFEQNVDVIVFSPGYIKTNLSINALTRQGETHGRMDESTAQGMDPLAVAQRIVLGIKNREKEVLMCDLETKIAICIRTLFPSFYFGLMARRARTLKAATRDHS